MTSARKLHNVQNHNANFISQIFDWKYFLLLMLQNDIYSETSHLISIYVIDKYNGLLYRLIHHEKSLIIVKDYRKEIYSIDFEEIIFSAYLYIVIIVFDKKIKILLFLIAFCILKLSSLQSKTYDLY